MDLEFYSVTFFESCHLEIMGLLRMVTPEPSVPVCPPPPSPDRPHRPSGCCSLGYSLRSCVFVLKPVLTKSFLFSQSAICF